MKEWGIQFFSWEVARIITNIKSLVSILARLYVLVLLIQQFKFRLGISFNRYLFLCVNWKVTGDELGINKKWKWKTELCESLKEMPGLWVYHYLPLISTNVFHNKSRKVRTCCCWNWSIWKNTQSIPGFSTETCRRYIRFI